MISSSLTSPAAGLHPTDQTHETDPLRRPFRSVFDFQKAKRQGHKISMLSLYDTIVARMAIEAGVNTLLVGDSVAMVVYGYESTIHATVEMIAPHVAAVRRAGSEIFLVADLPFGTFRRGVKAAMKAVETLVRAGASAVKLEGVAGNEKIISHLVESGIPVMGHLGLTPQSVLGLGGYRVQGSTEEGLKRLIKDARELENLGAFSLVLECVSSTVGARVSSQLTIPIIGIGAGAEVDGQVLVASDLLGLTPGPLPRFVRRYLDGKTLVSKAFEEFFQQVADGEYPSGGESYG
jgi:3-methyl-2-oxobutanoate hydroxymethyltransferase